MNEEVNSSESLAPEVVEQTNSPEDIKGLVDSKNNILNEKKQLQTERNSIFAELEAMKQEKKDQQLKEQEANGEYQKIADNFKTENDTLKAENKAYKKTEKARTDALENERQELLKTFSEEDQKDFANVDIKALNRFKNMTTTNNTSNSNPRPDNLIKEERKSFMGSFNRK